MAKVFTNNDHVTKAKLVNGKIVLYDKCSYDRYLSNPHDWDYLGFGKVFSVDNQPSNIQTKLHFWKRI